MLDSIDINAIVNETNTNLAFKLLMGSYKCNFTVTTASLSSGKRVKTKISSRVLIIIFICKCLKKTSVLKSS